MSTLQAALRQRRASSLPPKSSCDFAGEPVRALQIHLWCGEKWVLPWTQFLFARQQGGGADEKLVLSFVNHEVTLHGVHLAALLPEIAGLRLNCLREEPPEMQAEAENGEPLIRHVVVRGLRDENKPVAETF